MLNLGCCQLNSNRCTLLRVTYIIGEDILNAWIKQTQMFIWNNLITKICITTTGENYQRVTHIQVWFQKITDHICSKTFLFVFTFAPNILFYLFKIQCIVCPCRYITDIPHETPVMDLPCRCFLCGFESPNSPGCFWCSISITYYHSF